MTAKRATKKPTKTSSKKIAVPLRRLQNTAVEKAAFASRSHVDAEVTTLVRDIGAIIDAARKQVAVAANAALTTLYWQLGHRIRTEVLEGQRAEYGAQIVAAVGRQLESLYGSGFGEKNLRRMIQFATVFSDAEIVAALRRQLSWALSSFSSRSRTR